MENITLETIHKDLEYLKKIVEEMSIKLMLIEEKELQPTERYLQALKEIEKQPHFKFKDINDLRKQIESEWQ